MPNRQVVLVAPNGSAQSVALDPASLPVLANSFPAFVLGTAGGVFGARPVTAGIVFWICQNASDDPASTQTVLTGDVLIRPSS